MLPQKYTSLVIKHNINCELEFTRAYITQNLIGTYFSKLVT